MSLDSASPSAPTSRHRPGVAAFVTVGAIEAVVRGIMLAVYPLLMYRAWAEAAVVSKWYFLVGVVSLLTGLCVPMLTRHLPRRWVYSLGVLLYIVSAGLGMAGGKWTTLALLCHVTGTATVFVCCSVPSAGRSGRCLACGCCATGTVPRSPSSVCQP